MCSKKELRREILAGRMALTEREVLEKSEMICRRILETDLFAKATDICLYMPIRNEVDVTLLIEPARREGKGIWIPKAAGDEMIFNRYEEEKLELSEGFKILESTSGIILEPSERTLIIMPGAVFDRSGGRIGYGGGFYDRYLDKHPECRRMAVCYELQIVDRIPMESHDIRPETIVTENETIPGS